MPRFLTLSIAAAALSPAAYALDPPAVTAAAPSPAAQLAALVEADKAFATAAKVRLLPDAIGAMLAADAVMPARGDKPFLRSRAEIVAYLRANPASATAHASWTPVRGGISADGRHGFTAGFIELTQADGTKQPGKYMAYWARTPGGWRALAYKRAPPRSPRASIPNRSRGRRSTGVPISP